MDTIVNKDGEFRSATGPAAVNAYRLRTLIVGLEAEERFKGTGIRFSRISMLKVAKRTTGLRTNDRAAHIARLRVMLEQQLSEVLIITDGKEGT